jgi:CO/xanthine dehydrogenase Mo-binding subunit
MPPALRSPLTAANPAPGHLDTWLRIGPDESIKVFTGKVDIGMGVETALSQIVAEELDVAFGRIQFIMGDTASTPDQGGVGGSTSIANGAKPLRNAAASARLVLLRLAAGKLGVAPEQLQVSNGIVSVKDDASKSISYGALAAGSAMNEVLRVSGSGFGLKVEGQGKPKDPASYRVVGQSVPRIDLPPKILGHAMYSTDVRIPGMLHGRAIQPAGAGAKFVSLDESTVRHIPGYVKTVVKGHFFGVIAEGEPSSRPTGAAINNAVFDATGARIRTVPLTPARVKGRAANGKLKTDCLTAGVHLGPPAADPCLLFRR